MHSGAVWIDDDSTFGCNTRCMRSTGRTLSAVLAAIVLASCTGGGSERAQEQPPSSVTSAPSSTSDTRVETVRAEADLVRVSGGAAEVAKDSLVMRPFNESSLLSFPVESVDLECIVAADLRVTMRPTDLAIDAWVSLERDAAQITDGQSLGGLVIAHGSPSVPVHLSDDGTAEADVTELLRWARADLPEHRAFVIVLKPDFRTVADAPVEMGSLEGGDGGLIRLSYATDCANQSKSGGV